MGALCDTCDTSDTYDICHTVTQCDNVTQKVLDMPSHMSIREQDIADCDTLTLHVTPEVLQFIGPCNDGRRHIRGDFLLNLATPSHALMEEKNDPF
jgi:hypothetical protein